MQHESFESQVQRYLSTAPTPAELRAVVPDHVEAAAPGAGQACACVCVVNPLAGAELSR